MGQKRTKTYDLICQVCGAPFTAKTPIAMYCPECAHIRMRASQKAWGERRTEALRAEKAAMNQPKVTTTKISEIVKKASEEGVSYGYYVAHAGL